MRYFRVVAWVSIWALMGMAWGQGERMVVVDQDGSGPGGSNQMAMLALLQAPGVRVLGITMVSGNAWEPEEVQHTLRMLELTGHGEVPVVPGAVFPLLHDQRQAMEDAERFGGSVWYGAWGDRAKHTSGQAYHGAMEVPEIAEGMPGLKAAKEDAAHFLVRVVREHPHEVTVYEGGPMTNLALAERIDPAFAGLAKELVVMGGSLNPQTGDPEFATRPRHEFNFWWDAEAASVVLRSEWPKVTLVDVDVSLTTMWTKAMQAEVARSGSKAGMYLGRWNSDFYYMWDELAACLWVDPKIVTRERVLFLDVETQRGAEYGDTMVWTETDRPGYGVRPVHVVDAVDTGRFYGDFVRWMGR